MLEVASVPMSVSYSFATLVGLPELPLVTVVPVVTVVAVVPSVMVGKGAPIAPTITVAMTPVLPGQPATNPENKSEVSLQRK